jgi:hypothetical protein
MTSSEELRRNRRLKTPSEISPSEQWEQEAEEFQQPLQRKL